MTVVRKCYDGKLHVFIVVVRKDGHHILVENKERKS